MQDTADLYETLQISVNAEPDTVHRVYRLLAQRYHPDNKETGNPTRFRELTEAYRVLSDPAERARYDAVHERQREARWKLAEMSGTAEDDLDASQQLRATVLEVLYSKRRVEPNEAGVYQIDLEKLTGCPHEHVEFAMWYLVQKKLVQRTDQSLFAITAEGIDWLEERRRTAPRARRLAAVNQ